MALRAAAHARENRAPAYLHLKTVRLMGHAGSDVEIGYRTRREIAADLAHDPLVATARLLVEAGLETPEDLLSRYEAERDHVLKLAVEASRRPKLTSAHDITAPISPRDPVDRRDGVGRVGARPRGELPHPPRGRGPPHPGPGDQPHPGRPDAARPRHARLRRGRRPQGRGLRRDPQPRPPVRHRPRLRHAPRRTGHPRPGPGLRRLEPDPGPRDPISGLPAQRPRPDPRRGVVAELLLPGRLHQPRWSSASPAWPTRRASAATSTTTTPSPPSATSPAW